MVVKELGEFIRDTPAWFRIPLLLILLVVACLLAGLCVVLAIAVLQGRGVTAKWSGVEIAPKANSCVTFGQNVSQYMVSSKELLDNLKGQIAEFSMQANGTGSNRFRADTLQSDLLNKQDEVAKNREAWLKKLTEVCEKSER